MSLHPTNLYARQVDDVIPSRLTNEQATLQHNCQIVHLKNPSQINCVLQSLEGHELILTVYDPDKNGGFNKSQQFCIPSWYHKATVRYEDILGTGTQFMFIEFEGNTGTGTLQKILTIIGWHNGKFVPVLSETIRYDVSERESLDSLTMDYKVEHKNTPDVSLSLFYKLSLKNQENPSLFNASWSDILKWDNIKFSFYDDVAEESKLKNAPFYMQRNIAKARLALKQVSINRFCEDFFDKTNIMYILDETKY